jgi:hypothetical protein
MDNYNMISVFKVVLFSILIGSQFISIHHSQSQSSKTIFSVDNDEFTFKLEHRIGASIYTVHSIENERIFEKDNRLKELIIFFFPEQVVEMDNEIKDLVFRMRLEAKNGPLTNDIYRKAWEIFKKGPGELKVESETQILDAYALDVSDYKRLQSYRYTITNGIKSSYDAKDGIFSYTGLSLKEIQRELIRRTKRTCFWKNDFDYRYTYSFSLNNHNEAKMIESLAAIGIAVEPVSRKIEVYKFGLR